MLSIKAAVGEPPFDHMRKDGIRIRTVRQVAFKNGAGVCFVEYSVSFCAAQVYIMP
jgi:hypothetical protein